MELTTVKNSAKEFTVDLVKCKDCRFCTLECRKKPTPSAVSISVKTDK